MNYYKFWVIGNRLKYVADFIRETRDSYFGVVA